MVAGEISYFHRDLNNPQSSSGQKYLWKIQNSLLWKHEQEEGIRHSTGINNHIDWFTALQHVSNRLSPT